MSRLSILGLGLGLLLLFLCFLPVSLHGQENSESPRVPASLEDAKTAEEAEAYCNSAFAEMRKNIKTQEDEKRFRLEYGPIGIAAGEKIIALSENDEMLENGYQVKLFALDLLSSERPEYEAEFNALIEEIKKLDKLPKAMITWRFRSFYKNFKKMMDSKSVSDEDFAKYKKEAKELFASDIPHNFSRLEPLTSTLDLAQIIALEKNWPDFLDSTLNELLEFIQSKYATHDDQSRVEKILRGYCRRMVGRPFELYGKTVDGNDFCWDDYRGKYVLIDFTASTCGPCRAEMPNLLEICELYPDLRIVSVGVSDTTENLKKQVAEDKIPWAMISEELSKKEDRELPSDYYGVFGIPEIFLVGKDGKIIATELRGATLRSRADELFKNTDEE